MNPLLVLVCIVLVGLQIGLPRRWAFLPLLIAACHTPYTSSMEGLTVTRIMIMAGLLRSGVKGWLAWSPRNRLDMLVAVFAGVALLSTVGHAWQPNNPLVFRLRLVFDVVGTYLYMRAYLTTSDSLERYSASLVLVMIPLAFFLLVEKESGLNPYAALGTRNLYSLVRGGEFRAQGPFGTPVLAGTLGGSSIALLIPLLKTRRKLAFAGLVASVVIIYASGSSGPISTAMIGLAAVAYWRWRVNLRVMLGAVGVCLVILHFIKERPIWYLMALMDLVGGSTGWHRAYLIDMAVKHMDEWWLIGSDFTRHWMPYGLAAVPQHCDLTNYYIHLGVIAGLPIVFCLLVIQWVSFRMLGKRMRELRSSDHDCEFWLWCAGSASFAHAVTFISISYYDQVYVFFWGLLGGLTGFLSRDIDMVTAIPDELSNESANQQFSGCNPSPPWPETVRSIRDPE